MNIDSDDAAKNIVSLCHKIDDVIHTGGWKRTFSIDEQTCIYALCTKRDNYTDDEVTKVSFLLGVNLIDSNCYYSISSHSGYYLILFYDLSYIVVYIEPDENNVDKWNDDSSDIDERIDQKVKELL